MDMTPQRQKYLMERLAEIRKIKMHTANNYAVRDLDTAPDDVKRAHKRMLAAQKIVDAFYDEMNNTRENKATSIRAVSADCEREIMFGDADVALIKIDEFEAMEF